MESTKRIDGRAPKFLQLRRNIRTADPKSDEFSNALFYVARFRESSMSKHEYAPPAPGDKKTSSAAEEHRETAEAARESAETGREAAEGVRKYEETGRASAERIRAYEELGRQAAEEVRRTAEQARISADEIQAHLARCQAAAAEQELIVAEMRATLIAMRRRAN
jgi:hypothetical protein